MSIKKKCPVGTEIQSVFFDKDKFNTGTAARWLKRNGFAVHDRKKADIKENTIRFRQSPPGLFDKGLFRTINLTTGVNAVIGCRKKKQVKAENGGVIDEKIIDVLARIDGINLQDAIYYVQKKYPEIPERTIEEVFHQWQKDTGQTEYKNGGEKGSYLQGLNPQEREEYFDLMNRYKSGTLRNDYKNYTKNTNRLDELQKKMSDNYAKSAIQKGDAVIVNAGRFKDANGTVINMGTHGNNYTVAMEDGTKAIIFPGDIRKKMADGGEADWLFVGVYPNAQIYADKSKEQNGMYYEFGRIVFKPFEVKVYDNSPKYADALVQMRLDAERMKNEGSVQVSTVGQRVSINGADEMKKGGTLNKKVDLFQYPELMPAEVSEIIDRYWEEYGDNRDYEQTEQMKKELEAVGYTFDYGLDNEPYGLRQVGVKLNELEGSEEMKNGGATNRIDEMVKHYQQHSWAKSHVDSNDAEFFEKTGISRDQVGITSFTGDDIVYYDITKVYPRSGSMVKMGEGGTLTPAQKKEIRFIATAGNTEEKSMNLIEKRYKPTIHAAAKEYYHSVKMGNGGIMVGLNERARVVNPNDILYLMTGDVVDITANEVGIKLDQSRDAWSAGDVEYFHPTELEIVAGDGGVNEQYVVNIYNRQSEQPVDEQLHSFAREHGYDKRDVEKALKAFENSTEPDAWGEKRFTKDAIAGMVNMVSGAKMKSGGIRQKEYDEAFEKMYRKLLTQKISVETFNKRYDKWIRKNAPLYGFKKSDMEHGGALEAGIKVEQEHKDLYDHLKKQLEAEGCKMPMNPRQFYTWIAAAHLRERDDYYVLLKKYVEK